MFKQEPAKLGLYQPVPFPGSWDHPSRIDCEDRWKVISGFIGDLNAKSLVDLGAANCFFGFRFLQDGGMFVTGVEPEPYHCAFSNALARENEMALRCVRTIADVDLQDYDVGLYLDLHYHEGADYLAWIARRASLVFTSPSGDGNYNNAPFEKLLISVFSKVDYIYQKYANRKIFRCK